MHIPIMSRGNVLLMMVAAAVTPLFVGGAHALSGSEKGPVPGQSARAPSGSVVGSSEAPSAATSGDRLNAYLETANELWNRTRDARAVRELLRVAEEDLAAAAQPPVAPLMRSTAGAPAAMARVGGQIATTETPPAGSASTSPAAASAAPVPTIAATAAAPISHSPPLSFTIRASVHEHEGERLQRKLTAWRERFEILAAAGSNLAATAVPNESDDTEGPDPR